MTEKEIVQAKHRAESAEARNRVKEPQLVNLESQVALKKNNIQAAEAAEPEMVAMVVLVEKAEAAEADIMEVLAQVQFQILVAEEEELHIIVVQVEQAVQEL